MASYYNEIDPFMAAWLRQLIQAGHIPPGDVDERSIEDVAPAELKSYQHIHFFAGIGGWAIALRMAGWPDDKPVLTGSCPCQPYSTAGKGGGLADERHLWPAMFWHIQQLRPPTIFGEQVASNLALEWWDLVATDLERSNYAAAPFDLPAASVGSPQRRQRLFWVAHTQSSQGRDRDCQSPAAKETRIRGIRSGRLGQCSNPSGGLAHAQGQQRQRSRRARQWRARPSDGCNPWGTHQWIACLDGKQRAVEPSICVLAHGVSGRVGRLRGYGNAIVPPLAAEFIKAFSAI